MSKPTWEEEIETVLGRIEKKIDSLLGQGFETLKTGKKESTTSDKLESGTFVKKLVGTMVDDPVCREVDTKRGPTDIANFRLQLDNEEVRVGLWGELANSILSETAGSIIELTNMSVKEPFDGLTQVSSTRKTEIKVID